MPRDEPRRFTDLRAAAKNTTENKRELASLALQVFASTPHGDAFKEYLSSVVFDVTDPKDGGAWQETHGRRKFADELLVMMDGFNDRNATERSPDPAD